MSSILLTMAIFGQYDKHLISIWHSRWRKKQEQAREVNHHCCTYTIVGWRRRKFWRSFIINLQSSQGSSLQCRTQGWRRVETSFASNSNCRWVALVSGWRYTHSTPEEIPWQENNLCTRSWIFWQIKINQKQKGSWWT